MRITSFRSAHHRRQHLHHGQQHPRSTRLQSQPQLLVRADAGRGAQRRHQNRLRAIPHVRYFKWIAVLLGQRNRWAARARQHKESF